MFFIIPSIPLKAETKRMNAAEETQRPTIEIHEIIFTAALFRAENKNRQAMKILVFIAISLRVLQFGQHSRGCRQDKKQTRGFYAYF